MKTVLFDLDGTLLPMNQEEFIQTYFKLLAKKLYPYGYDPKKLIDGIWKGTASMVKNDGTKTNEVVFWDAFEEIFGKDVRKDIPIFEDFYANEFNLVKDMFKPNPLAIDLIKYLKGKGVKIVLASNPIFPLIGQKNRMKWAGLDIKDFDYITCYENSSFCKPNPKYYQEILNLIGSNSNETIMVGNDVNEDMVANDIGISVFLLTDCLINKNDIDINKYNHGDFVALKTYLDSVI